MPARKDPKEIKTEIRQLKSEISALSKEVKALFRTASSTDKRRLRKEKQLEKLQAKL
jgi:prefoldin subunit 5